LDLEHKNHDKVFFINFGVVMAALGAFFFVCVIAARLIQPKHEMDAESLKRLEARITLPGQAVTDPAALMKVAAASSRAPYTGDEVIAKYCGACHTAGVLGAPKIGDKGAWATHSSAAGGLDGLTASAIKGKNSMPARGGDPDLKDEEIKAAIEIMLKKSGI
jgi:cytochrome c5